MTVLSKYRRFIGWFAGLTVGLPLMLTAIQALTGFNLHSSATAIIPMMVASQVEGMAYARRENHTPKGREAWGLSIRLAVIAAIISVFFAAILFAFNADLMAILSSLNGIMFLSGIAVIFFVLFILLGRLFLTIGARAHIKGVAKKQKKTNS